MPLRFKLPLVRMLLLSRIYLLKLMKVCLYINFYCISVLAGYRHSTSCEVWLPLNLTQSSLTIQWPLLSQGRLFLHISDGHSCHFNIKQGANISKLVYLHFSFQLIYGYHICNVSFLCSQLSDHRNISSSTHC